MGKNNSMILVVVILSFHAIVNVGPFKIDMDIGNGKALRFYKLFEYCNDPKQYTILYSHMKIHLINGVNYIDLNCTVKQPLSRLVKMSIAINRCTSMESPDTCTKMPTMNTNKFCDFIADNTSFYSSMLTCWSPRPLCPVKKAVYVGTGCTIDMAKFNWFPLGNNFWNVELIMSDLRTKEVLTCFKFAVQPVRKTR